MPPTTDQERLMSLETHDEGDGVHGWVRAEPWSIYVYLNDETNQLTVDVYPDTDRDAGVPLQTIVVDYDESRFGRLA